VPTAHHLTTHSYTLPMDTLEPHGDTTAAQLWQTDSVRWTISSGPNP